MTTADHLEPQDDQQLDWWQNGIPATAYGKCTDGKADVIGKTQKVDVEIRDIEEATTKDEVNESLEKAIDKDYVAAANAVKSLRKAYWNNNKWKIINGKWTRCSISAITE